MAMFGLAAVDASFWAFRADVQPVDILDPAFRLITFGSILGLIQAERRNGVRISPIQFVSSDALFLSRLKQLALRLELSVSTRQNSLSVPGASLSCMAARQTDSVVGVHEPVAAAPAVIITLVIGQLVGLMRSFERLETLKKIVPGLFFFWLLVIRLEHYVGLPPPPPRLLVGKENKFFSVLITLGSSLSLSSRSNIRTKER